MPAFRDKIAVLSRVVGSQSLIPADVDRSGFSRDYSTETDCSVVKPTPERGVGSHYRTVGRTALQFLRDINKKSRPCKNSWLQNRYGGKNGLFSGTNTGSLTVRYVLLDSVGLLCVSAGLGGVTAVLHRSFRTSRVTISREDSSLSGPVTVALLLQRNVALEWHEAVAVVLEIAEGLERSGRTVLPTYQDLELRPDGSIRFLRDPSRAGESLARLVDICRALLPADSPAHVWALVSGTGPDAPVYESTQDFAASLRPVERSGRRHILAEVYRRALDTPLPDGLQDSGGQDTAQTLPVRMLDADEIRTRKHLAEVPESLVASIREHRLLPPVLVRQTRAGYELVAGSRWLV